MRSALILKPSVRKTSNGQTLTLQLTPGDRPGGHFGAPFEPYLLDWC